MKRKLVVLIALALPLASLLTACSQLDLVGKESVNSFDKMTKAAAANVSVDQTFNGWDINAPDKKAKFIIASDFSKSPMHDVMLEADLQPFINAGLDVTKLPEDMIVNNVLHVGTKLSTKAFAAKTPQEAFEQAVKVSRDSVKYHKDLDHYGLALGNGNMFEWAKDVATNSKDIVFVLNPQPFIDAGVDPNKVDGWVFAKVKVTDENGKDVLVDKLLKPFNLQ